MSIYQSNKNTFTCQILSPRKKRNIWRSTRRRQRMASQRSRQSFSSRLQFIWRSPRSRLTRSGTWSTRLKQTIINPITSLSTSLPTRELNRNPNCNIRMTTWATVRMKTMLCAYHAFTRFMSHYIANCALNQFAQHVGKLMTNITTQSASLALKILKQPTKSSQKLEKCRENWKIASLSAAQQ